MVRKGGVSVGYRNVFKRYEIKYLLTRQQQAQILKTIAPYMALDQYGRTTIRNIYFDTDSYRLIRRSLEKPTYKEKLRIRSYRQADPQSPVFVELKKKYNGIVYKRRLAMPERQAMDWACGGTPCPAGCQIADEINYFISYYGDLRPTVFLSYDRQAYYCRSGGDFRITFDDNILCRQEALSLEAEIWGVPILEADKVLMEIKTSGSIPLWLTRVLTREKIFKTSFSKYGTAYETMIFNGGYKNAAKFVSGDI